TDAATLYAALTDGTKSAAQVKAVSDAFTTYLGANGATDFNTLKSLAATDYTKNVAVEAEDTAEAAVTAATGGTAFLGAYDTKVTADTTLANAQAADALVNQAKAITAAHDALEDSAAAVTVPAYVQDLNASVTGQAGADLFHFADGVKGTDDFTITGFNKGDALYIGEGFTLANGVTTGTDGFYTGTNTAVKEVFFIQDSTSKVVSAVIETNAVGNAEGGSAANVAVIELAGITNLSDVSFANGIITSNHVA
ncbi:MAG: outer rane adhesin-like protein, partial [Pseudomonas sp.]|nr:outer rane adhesin-like protein [Pseudomonas sp.]